MTWSPVFQDRNRDPVPLQLCRRLWILRPGPDPGPDPDPTPGPDLEATPAPDPGSAITGNTGRFRLPADPDLIWNFPAGFALGFTWLMRGVSGSTPGLTLIPVSVCWSMIGQSASYRLTFAPCYLMESCSDPVPRLATVHRLGLTRTSVVLLLQPSWFWSELQLLCPWSHSALCWSDRRMIMVPVERFLFPGFLQDLKSVKNLEFLNEEILPKKDFSFYVWVLKLVLYLASLFCIFPTMFHLSARIILIK